MGFTIEGHILTAYTEEPGVTAVTVPDGVRTIGWGAFREQTALTAVTLPPCVGTIGRSAFKGCTSLTAVRIPGTVVEVGPSAFDGCTRLAALRLGDGVEIIGKCAFDGCTSLTTVTIPESVWQIGVGAFAHCTRLRSVTLPERVWEMGQFVFSGCTRLTTLRLPAWRVGPYPTPALYASLSIEDQIDMYRLFSHRLQENAIFPETRLRILCGLLASGYREASFLAAVRRSRPHLLAYAIRSDDVPALRAILRDAPLSDRDLETLIVRAAEQDAKACYIVLVGEKKKRGLLVDDERRL